MDELRVQSGPDKLKDLSLLYCMNNLDILIQLSTSLASGGDVASLFPMSLGNQMVEYYMKCGFMSKNNELYVDQLLQNDQVCSQLTLTRQYLVSADNVIELANNPIRSLDMIVWSNGNCETEEAQEHLLRKNVEGITKISLKNKIDGDPKKVLDILNGNLPVLGRSGDVENPKGTGDNLSPANTSFSLANVYLNCCQMEVESTESMNESASTAETNEKLKCPATNLKTFSFEQVSGDMDKVNCKYEHMFKVFSDIVENNPGLVSFNLVVASESGMASPYLKFVSEPCISQFQHLQSLVLSINSLQTNADHGSNVTGIFTLLPGLKNLRHLDISEVPGVHSRWSEQTDEFITAIKAMPKLKSLDIAGTKLGRIIGHADPSCEECTDHCMPGFEGRQFEYLGLYGCNYEACKHTYIPAQKVSGSSSDEQYLVALWSYQHNIGIMEHVLRNLVRKIQTKHYPLQQAHSFYDGFVSYLEKIRDSIESVDKQMKAVVYNVLFCLFYLLKHSGLKKSLTIQQKRRLFDCYLVYNQMIVNMFVTGQEGQMISMIVRLFSLLMLLLKIDNIVVCSYRYLQYIETLLIVYHSRTVEANKELALALLHSAIRHSQEYKALAGSKGHVVKRLLMCVMDHVNTSETTNGRLEKIWSIMWSLTDEVPSNCALFVQNGGCQMAQTCITKYEEETFNRVITGAMNNVAENFELHEYLMTPGLINVFRRLLECPDPACLDRSAHSVGFLIMLASRGPEVWTVANPSRETILAELETTIKQWDITSVKGVKFRSLSPMLRQVENSECGVAQLWGAWEILNLLKVKPEAYCSMFIEEGGVAVVTKVLHQHDLRGDVKDLLIGIQACVDQTLTHQAQIQAMI